MAYYLPTVQVQCCAVGQRNMVFRHTVSCYIKNYFKGIGQDLSSFSNLQQKKKTKAQDIIYAPKKSANKRHGLGFKKTPSTMHKNQFKRLQGYILYEIV